MIPKSAHALCELRIIRRDGPTFSGSQVLDRMEGKDVQVSQRTHRSAPVAPPQGVAGIGHQRYPVSLGDGAESIVVAGLTGIVLQVVPPAAVQHVHADATAGRRERLAQVTVLELQQRRRRRRLTRLDHVPDVGPGTVQAAQVVAVDALVAGSLADPSTRGPDIHRRPAGVAHHQCPLVVDVRLPAEGLLQPAA